MTDKAWKQFERRVAKYIGGERVPITGRQRGDAPDIKHAWLSVECKYRKKLPNWLFEARAQAEASKVGVQLPVQIYAQKGQNTGDAFIVMRLQDFRDRYL